jgi:hypothetical protein
MRKDQHEIPKMRKVRRKKKTACTLPEGKIGKKGSRIGYIINLFFPQEERQGVTHESAQIDITQSSFSPFFGLA